MLEGYGFHKLTWDTCDERFGDVLVASPADARGRGISLAVRQDGAGADLTGAHFATKKYVDDTIAALDDLSGVSF